MVMSPGGNVVCLAHSGSGLPLKAVVPLSPSVIPSLRTVTVTGDAPGFTTRIGIAAVSPGVSVSGSGGTETAIERRPDGPGVGEDPAETPSGTATMPAAIAMMPASHPLPHLRLVCYPTITSSWAWLCR